MSCENGIFAKLREKFSDEEIIQQVTVSSSSTYITSTGASCGGKPIYRIHPSVLIQRNPEGYFHSISDAPEGYVDNFKTLLTSVYSYTMTSENVYVNEEVGLQIELVEEDGYQYYYFSIVE
jgi:hypothetical protein